jgi:hypothetical protein
MKKLDILGEFLLKKIEKLLRDKKKVMFFGSVGGLLVAVIVGVLVVSGVQQNSTPQAVESPTASSSPEPSMVAGTSVPSESIEGCKIQDATGVDGYIQAGFPNSPTIANSGVVK